MCCIQLKTKLNNAVHLLRRQPAYVLDGFIACYMITEKDVLSGLSQLCDLLFFSTYATGCQIIHTVYMLIISIKVYF